MKERMSFEYKLTTEAPKKIILAGDNLSAFQKTINGFFEDSKYAVPFSKENALLIRKFLTGRSVEISLKDKRILATLAGLDDAADVNTFRWENQLTELIETPMAKKFGKIVSEWDLIHYLPIRYIDKTNPQKVAELEIGAWSVVVGEIVNEVTYDHRRDLVKIVVQDVTGGRISASFFRQKWLAWKFKEGDEVVLYGNYSEYIDQRKGGRYPQITNAKIDKLGDIRGDLPMIPIYPQKSGDKTWQLQQEVTALLNTNIWFDDPVPERILSKYNLMTRDEAYRKIHFPETREEADRARERIAFDEFIRLQVFFHSNKEQLENSLGRPKLNTKLADKFVSSLPFDFTGAQLRVTKEIASDMAKDIPMYRLLQGDVGSGKAQPLYSKVLTPAGFKEMGNVQVGDVVLTPDGKTSSIIGVFPQGKRAVYELTFHDGSTVRADENHLWSVTSTEPTKENSSNELLTTLELEGDLISESGQPKWFVDLPKIVGLGGKWSSSIDPYTLGSLLSNPLSDFSTPSTQEILDELRNLGLEDASPWVRFIPKQLLNSDETSRLSLLQGLLDSAGLAEAGRGYSFTSPSWRLADDVVYLVRSLGGTARMDYENSDNGGSFSSQGQLPESLIPFRLPAKKNAFLHMLATKISLKAILSIKYVGLEDTQCIKLADPKGLYITDDFTVTHNTEISTYTTLVAVASGYQVGFLAPTDILASQLFERLEKDLKRADLSDKVVIGLMSGKMKVKEKRELLLDLKEGRINILVGTHAIIQKGVEFQDLGLVIIDEQHKFGTEQRSTLRDNNTRGGVPDMLTMSATPIPRTTAQVVYGDMEISVIDELPPGRTPIKTVWSENPKEAWAKIREQVELGHQAYVVASLVEESEKMENIESAVQTYEFLANKIFPDISVGLLHGKMSKEEKDQVIHLFYENKVQILVATTVVEVGVNVPNATVMTILNANRFGIASLHQIRGRVGRGVAESYCFLVGEATNGEAEERLTALVASTDGFWLAEKDLEIRGEGALFGSAQSGMSDMFVGNLRDYKDILEIAKTVAPMASSSKMLKEEIAVLYKDKMIGS